MKKSQIARIFYIHEEIKAGGFPNSEELAEKWEGVSSKTIRRDIEYLKDMMNAPIAYKSTKRGYYYTEPSFDIPSFMLSEGDFFALAIGEVVLGEYQTSPFYNRLKNIFERIRNNLPEKIRFDSVDIKETVSLTHYSQVVISPDIFNPVLEAITSNSIINVRYCVPRYNDSTFMTIEPYKIVAHRGNWYLIGNHIQDDKFKVWAINRIEEIDITKEKYILPESFNLEDHIDADLGIFMSNKRQKVSLRFSKTVAGIIKERKWHEGQVLEEFEDGSLLLTYETNQLEETFYWALSWGENVIIEEPEKLVEKAKNTIEKMVKLYK